MQSCHSQYSVKTRERHAVHRRYQKIKPFGTPTISRQPLSPQNFKLPQAINSTVCDCCQFGEPRQENINYMRKSATRSLSPASEKSVQGLMENSENGPVKARKSCLTPGRLTFSRRQSAQKRQAFVRFAGFRNRTHLLQKLTYHN